MQGRWRKRPLSLTPGSKEKLPPLVLLRLPRTRQIHLRQPHLSRTLPPSHLCLPLLRNNPTLHRWTSLLNWPAMASWLVTSTRSISKIICTSIAVCCSNHSLLKDKWSHNKQSSLVGYQVTNEGITRELDKELSLHCSSIYIAYKWSMPQQCVYLMSIHHASTSCPITHPHVFSIRLPCFLHVPWRHTLNLHCTCAHHVYTMRNSCLLTSLLTLTLI